MFHSFLWQTLEFIVTEVEVVKVREGIEVGGKASELIV